MRRALARAKRAKNEPNWTSFFKENEPDEPKIHYLKRLKAIHVGNDLFYQVVPNFEREINCSYTSTYLLILREIDYNCATAL